MPDPLVIRCPKCHVKIELRPGQPLAGRCPKCRHNFGPARPSAVGRAVPIDEPYVVTDADVIDEAPPPPPPAPHRPFRPSRPAWPPGTRTLVIAGIAFFALGSLYLSIKIADELYAHYFYLRMWIGLRQFDRSLSRNLESDATAMEEMFRRLDAAKVEPPP